jgi:hypothetical protein
MRLGACALAVLVLAVPACGGSSGPAGAARIYVEAILDKDGARLCRLIDPATRRQIDGVIAQARREGGAPGPLDCPHVAATLIGYPHENMEFRFVGGRLLAVGRSRAVGRYLGVDVRVRLKLEPNGSYAPEDSHALSPTLTDTVWLAKGHDGWRTAKPSLTLLAAWDGDVLGGDRLLDRARARDAVQPPSR